MTGGDLGAAPLAVYTGERFRQGKRRLGCVPATGQLFGNSLAVAQGDTEAVEAQRTGPIAWCRFIARTETVACLLGPASGAERPGLAGQRPALGGPTASLHTGNGGNRLPE